MWIPNKAFYFKKPTITESDRAKANNALDAYTKNKSDEDRLICDMVDASIIHRQATYDGLFDDITEVLKGQILDPEMGDMFAVETGNNEALTIMNSKAAIFDVKAINVELKPTVVTEEDDFKATDVEAINRILNESYLTKNQYEFTFADAIKYSRAYPFAISQIGWDNNATLGSWNKTKGDITTENIDIKSFWWDPAANNIENCEFVFTSKMLNYRQIASFIDQLKSKRGELLDAFFINSTYQGVATEGTSSYIKNSDLVNNGSIELISFFHKLQDKVKVYYIVGREFVIAKQDFPINYLPFAILKEHAMPNAFTGISSVMAAMPYIKQKMYIDGVSNNILLKKKDVTYLVDGTSGIDPKQLLESRTSGGAKALVTNGANPQAVSIVPSEIIDQQMLLLRDRYDQELNKSISSSDVANGISFGSALSGGAVQNMVDQATIKENTSVVELKRYLVRFIQIMLEFMKVKFSQSKSTLRFRTKTTEDNQGEDTYTFVDITAESWDKLEAEIDLDVSLLRTSRKNKQLQDLFQLYQFELQYTGKANFITIRDIVEQLNIPSKLQVMKRLEQQDEQYKYGMALQLVQGVMQLMQNPETAGQMSMEEAVQLVLAQIEEAQRGGNQ